MYFPRVESSIIVGLAQARSNVSGKFTPDETEGPLAKDKGEQRTKWELPSSTSAILGIIRHMKLFCGLSPTRAGTNFPTHRRASVLPRNLRALVAAVKSVNTILRNTTCLTKPLG